MKATFIILFLGLTSNLFAQLSAEQEKTIAELQKGINEAQHDSIILKAWRAWDDIIYSYDPNLDYELNFKIDSLSALNLAKHLSRKERVFFLQQKAAALNILVGLNSFKGKALLAQKYAFEALKVREELGDPAGVAEAMSNIAIFYNTQHEYPKAIKYLDSAIVTFKNLANIESLAMCYNNLGVSYMEYEIFDSAIFYFDNCLVEYKKLGDESKFAAIHNNMGLIYKDLERYNKAIESYQKSIEICERYSNFSILGNSFNNTAVVYQIIGQHQKSIRFAQKGLDLGKQYKLGIVNSESCRIMYLSYKAIDKPAQALAMFENFIAYNDTLEDENNKQIIMDQKYAFEYGLKAAQDSIAAAEMIKVTDAKLVAQEAESSKQKQQKYFLYLGLFVAILLGGFVLNRLKISQKQKALIAEKKKEVDLALLSLEEKNKEITDSINYAKRIQSAILPSSQKLKEVLPNHFITYIPKDIVAGDFYWLQEIGNKILFAACDCTGHGVPGAMVSVVCNNGLNRSVKEFGLTDPAQILDKTRELVIEEFSKSDEEVKDGMDIALCSLEGSKLTFAGAHNPLWIIRNGTDVIEEIKGDKQPVGVFEKAKGFKSHEVSLEKGDTVYIFTDGYADQFGGDKGKKLKTANFKSLLLALQNDSMVVQKEKIQSEFDEWKGSLEQLDDVCIIGLRV